MSISKSMLLMGNMMMFSYFVPRMIVFRFKKPCRHGKEGYDFCFSLDKRQKLQIKIKEKKNIFGKIKVYFLVFNTL